MCDSDDRYRSPLHFLLFHNLVFFQHTYTYKHIGRYFRFIASKINLLVVMCLKHSWLALYTLHAVFVKDMIFSISDWRKDEDETAWSFSHPRCLVSIKLLNLNLFRSIQLTTNHYLMSPGFQFIPYLCRTSFDMKKGFNSFSWKIHVTRNFLKGSDLIWTKSFQNLCITN